MAIWIYLAILVILIIITVILLLNWVRIRSYFAKKISYFRSKIKRKVRQIIEEIKKFIEEHPKLSQFIEILNQAAHEGYNFYRHPKPTKEKTFEILIFAFMAFFIGTLLKASIPLLSITVNTLFEKPYSNIFTAFFLVIALCIISLLYIIQSKSDSSSPYFYSLLFIFFFLLPRPETLIKVIILLVTLLILFPSFAKKWEKPKWLVLSTILLMVIVLFLGLLALFSLYGDKTYDTTILFNYCGNNTNDFRVNMTCENGNSGLLAGYYTECKTGTHLENITGAITFYNVNGSQEVTSLNNSISFLPPENLGRINFKINALDEENISLCLDTTWNTRLPTYDEYKTDREKFIAYLFALLGIIFFTIPVAVKQFEDIGKK